MAQFDVLIVDDDDVTRDGWRELLAGEGFTVDTAQDGSQALDTIRRNDVGVVLLDVGLPGISGLDVLASCANERSPTKWSECAANPFSLSTSRSWRRPAAPSSRRARRTA
jgi:CheY-like chemotaxis protein